MVSFKKSQIIVIIKSELEAEIIDISNYGPETGDLCYLIESESGHHRLMSIEDIKLKN
jgi:hypothetical protein